MGLPNFLGRGLDLMVDLVATAVGHGLGIALWVGASDFPWPLVPGAGASNRSSPGEDS